MKHFILCLTLLTIMILLCGSMQQVPADVVWGSFDESRINYPEGTLTGAAHSTLRSIIKANGGVIRAPTGTLTPAYLSGVDVFYTSLLSWSTGVLSSAEQAALQAWIANGGTLIVTADIFPLEAYESFTSVYGVTNYTSLAHAGTGSPVAVHMITENITSYDYNTESTFTFGGDALLLGNNGFGDDFMIVMEPGTGFSAGGRILVFGDHNMFTDSLIASNDSATAPVSIEDADNSMLAANMAAWAAKGEWPAVYSQIFKRTSLESALSTLRRYRDGIIAANPEGRQLVDGLYQEHSERVAKILLSHPELMANGASLIREHLSGLESVLNGGQMRITPSELAEVKVFLSNLAKFGNLRLKVYIGSIQKMLNRKDLELFGIKLVSRINAAPPRSKRGNLTTTWGSIKHSVEDQWR